MFTNRSAGKLFLTLVLTALALKTSFSAEPTLTLKASFAPADDRGVLVRSVPNPNCRGRSPRFENVGVLHPLSAQIVWKVLADNQLADLFCDTLHPKLPCVSDHGTVLNFLPWLGYTGDRTDFDNLKERFTRQLRDPELQRKTVFPLQQYAITLGAFRDRDLPGSREFVEQLLPFKFWEDKQLYHAIESAKRYTAWEKLPPEDRRDRITFSRTREVCQFTLRLSNWSRLPPENVQQTITYLTSRERQGHEDSAKILIMHSLDAETIEAKNYHRSYFRNPPRVTTELNRELEAKFDDMYTPELKKYLEGLFRECEMEVKQQK